MEEESKLLSTINTTKGLFVFNRLPFGIKTASHIFQRTMERIYQGLEGIIVYQDDILVFASSDNELKDRSSKLLERLNKRNFSINWEKSVRNSSKITFLGHVISENGIEPDPKLVKRF